MFVEIFFVIETKRLFDNFLKYIVFLGQKYSIYQEERTKKQISSYFDPIREAIMRSATIDEKEKEIQMQLLEEKFESLYQQTSEKRFNI